MKFSFKIIIFICCIMQMQHLHPMVAAEEELVTSEPESEQNEAYTTISEINTDSNVDTDNEELFDEPAAFTIQIEQEPVLEQLTKPEDEAEEVKILGKKISEEPEESSEETPVQNEEKKENAQEEIIEQEEIMSE